MSKLSNEEENIKQEEEYLRDCQAQHPGKIYKCHKCGKAEKGKDLDNLSINNPDESWYFEGIVKLPTGTFPHLFQVPPQYNIKLVSVAKAYCNTCGKVRKRELDLLNAEKMKTEFSEKIYKCYNCGKTLTGESFDDLFKKNRDKSWYIESKWGEKRIIGQLPRPSSSEGIEFRYYCTECGKLRERELELLRVEEAKAEASGKIVDELKRIKYELDRYNSHREYRE